MYEKGRIAISIDLGLIKKIDNIKKFPMWKNNRSAVIENIITEFFEREKK